MTDDAQGTAADSLEPVSLRTASLALLTVALWGGNPVAVSFSVDTLPPVAVAGIRFAMATAFMLFWCRLEGAELRLRKGQRLPVSLAALGLFLQIATFNIAVQLSNSSHASMMTGRWSGIPTSDANRWDPTSCSAPRFPIYRSKP